MKKTITFFTFIILLFAGLFGCEVNNNYDDLPPIVENGNQEDCLVSEDGLYTSKDEVALYIYTYKKLPKNYKTKSEVDGHISYYWTRDNLLSIGGDRFYNREGLLPKKTGRLYYEADINYLGNTSRGQERIVFSNDGLIFYTGDHYQSFIEYDKEERVWKSS
ncbi:MAG: ribonuclease domain-containing protein [Bacilli bacterium]|nr:ribonuclease domain-containing protein [Bacilli bacterium]